MVRGRQGSRRLDGRRHAARGAVATTIAACTISSGRTSARSPTRRSTRLRETRVMTPEDPARQSRQRPRRGRRAVRDAAAADRRSLLNAEFEAMRDYMGDTACRDRLHLRSPRAASDALRDALRPHPPRGRGRGARAAAMHIILTDDATSTPTRAAIPMILATGARAHAPGAPAAAHLHLAQRALGRMPRRALFRRADRRRRHHGERLSRGGDASPTAMRAACSASMSLDQCLARYKKAVDEGLLKIMSKMGISVISSYRGGCNFEAIGLSRSLVPEFFPGMPSRISGIGLRGIAGEDRRAACARLRRGRDRAADRRLLQLPPRRRDARLRGRR